MIPVLDLTAQYERLRLEIDAAVQSVLRSGNFILGDQVRSFEAEIASYLGTKNAITMNSGTDALHLALRALEVGPGDEVITSPFTFIATTEAIGIVGARPVFVDIDASTFNIDVSKIESAITPRTKAILPVHLYGLAAPMDVVMDIATRHNLKVIEDCAQAIGAKCGGHKVGTIGHIGCFSFFPSKNLGAYGDGGMACTDDPDIAQRLGSLRAHGGKVKYHHEQLGINSRLDELQAAVLRVKLNYLDRWNQRRREIAAEYDRLLAHEPAITRPRLLEAEQHVFHQYTVRVRERDKVQRGLRVRGVQTMVYYPVPLHLQKVHAILGGRIGAFPESEQAATEVLSLPIYPELRDEQIDIVVRNLVDIVCDSISV